MFWLILACTVGSTGPATPGSPSATESENMAAIATMAGQLSNASRELEEASIRARQRIANGADPETEAQALDELMKNIENIESQLQTAQRDLEGRLSNAQSTEETRK